MLWKVRQSRLIQLIILDSFSLSALEQDAASRQRKGPSPRHIAPGEVKFLSDLIQKYGTNYEVSLPRKLCAIAV